jgi:hypothetical protein
LSPAAEGFATAGGVPPGPLPSNMPGLPDIVATARSSFHSAFAKGKPSRFLDFLDFKFKRYLTPWIVRHVWLWGVCLLSLGLMVQVATYLYKSLPRLEEVSVAVPLDAKLRKDFVDDLIRNRKTPKVQETPHVDEPRRPAPGVAQSRKPEVDWHDEYSKMTLRQLIAERTSLDEKFPERGTRLTLWSIFYLTAVVTAILGTILTLVALRVCCELMIVVFDIAASLTAIANNTALSGRSSRD